MRDISSNARELIVNHTKLSYRVFVDGDALIKGEMTVDNVLIYMAIV